MGRKGDINLRETIQKAGTDASWGRMWKLLCTASWFVLKQEAIEVTFFWCGFELRHKYALFQNLVNCPLTAGNILDITCTPDEIIYSIQ